MKNLYSKNEFLNLKQEDELLNEGFLGKMFKSLWNSTVKLANKIKGSKEINAVYDKYKKMVDDTFAKMTNVETVKGVNPEKPAETPAPASGATNASYSFSGVDKLNEADATATATAPATAPVKETPEQQKNTEEQKNMVHLTPEQIKNAADITTKRIEELKKQFETEINGIVTKLSKNPDYSSDKLTQFSLVMKNQFNSYMYEQWYGFYQKVGDKNKVLELTKTKKESDLAFKKSLDELNSKLGEQQEQVQVKKGTEYTYFSKKNNADINVQVMGELGKDEKGVEDPQNKGNYKVKSVKTGTMFWVPASAIKTKVIKPKDFKVGSEYTYTNEEGKTSQATVTKVADNGVNVKTVMNQNGWFIDTKDLGRLSAKK